MCYCCVIVILSSIPSRGLFWMTGKWGCLKVTTQNPMWLVYILLLYCSHSNCHFGGFLHHGIQGTLWYVPQKRQRKAKEWLSKCLGTSRAHWGGFRPRSLHFNANVHGEHEIVTFKYFSQHMGMGQNPNTPGEHQHLAGIYGSSSPF